MPSKDDTMHEGRDVSGDTRAQNSVAEGSPDYRAHVPVDCNAATLQPKFETHDKVWLKVPRKPAAEVTITACKQDGETGRWSYKVEDKAGLQVNLRDYTTEPQWFSESWLSNNK